MARKVPALPTDQLKREPKPNLTSRVERLEKLVCVDFVEPQAVTLSQLLSAKEGADAFTEFFDAHILDSKLVCWEVADEIRNGTVGVGARFYTARHRNLVVAHAITSEQSKDAKNAPLWRPIIWGALLGAAGLAAILSLCNPTVFRPGVTRAQLGQVLENQWTVLSQKCPQDKPMMVGLERGAPVCKEIPGTVLLPSSSIIGTPPPLSEPTYPYRVPLNVTVDRECWVKIGNFHSRVLSADSGWTLLNAPLPHSIEVRSGCPGAIHYQINGEEVHPFNESKKPAESEIVTLYP